jgi:hypothetical protein
MAVTRSVTAVPKDPLEERSEIDNRALPDKRLGAVPTVAFEERSEEGSADVAAHKSLYRKRASMARSSLESIN